MNVRNQVVDFLRKHPSINAVNFQFKAYKIWPEIYRKDVANAVASGEIKIGSGVNEGAAATYRQSWDRLEISPTANFASINDLGLILHECTHAIVDMRSIGNHSAHEDEALAYLAQGFFLTSFHGDANTVSDTLVPLSADNKNGSGIYGEARRIAAKAIRTGAYRIQDKDADNLISLVAHNPHYRKEVSYPSNRFRRNIFYGLLR